jgi:hypothetical protein
MGEIGRGSVSVVYRARHRETGAAVALKVLKESDTANPNYLKRFQQEAQAASRLSHANIVPGPRLRRAGRVVLHRDAHRRGRDARPRDGYPPARAEAVRGGAGAGGPGGPPRPRARDRPSRPEAREHHPRLRRTAPCERLRAGQDGPPGEGRHPGRRRRQDRDALLHVARAGDGRHRGHRREERHLRAGRDALRGADRQGALPRHVGRPGLPGHPQRHPRRAVDP